MNKSFFSVESNPRYILNLLSSANISLTDIKLEGEGIRFAVPSTEEERVSRILTKCNRKFRVLYRTGRAVKLKSGALRFGLWAGFAVGIVLIFLYAGMLTGVEIGEIHVVSEEKIYAALAEVGVKTPAFFQKTDVKKVASALRKVDGVSDVSVRLEGTRLVIDVLERLPENEIVDTQTPIPIISERDGIVTEITVLQGTALVKVGDSVKKGQTLIAPYITSGETEVPCRAMGSVKAKTYYSRTAVYSDTTLAPVDTGRKKTVNGFELPFLKWEGKPPFAVYRVERNRKSGTLILPFVILEDTYYEQKLSEVPFDYETERERLIEENLTALKGELPQNYQQEKWWYAEKRVDKSTHLSIYYEIVTEISR